MEYANKSTQLPEGYSLQIVLSEAQIEAVTMAWNDNGVFYFVEMRNRMQTSNEVDEQTPKSRISSHGIQIMTVLMTRSKCSSIMCCLHAGYYLFMTDNLFPITYAKYLKITHIGKVNELYWSILEI